MPLQPSEGTDAGHQSLNLIPLPRSLIFLLTPFTIYKSIILLFHFNRGTPLTQTLILTLLPVTLVEYASAYICNIN